MEPATEQRSRSNVSALLLGCLLYSIAAYFLFEWILGELSNASVTFTFLVAVPAALASFVSYVSDPERRRGLGFHAALALVPMAIVIVGGLLLHEGVICILMLLPLWSLSALLATTTTYFLRRAQRRRDGLRASAILLAPLLVAQIEAASPVPVSEQTVRRTIVIDASPDRVWPLLVSIPDIAPEEGRWNVAQDVLNVPRPTEAVIASRHGRPVRLAQWGPHVRFEERIVEWTPSRALRWDFAFPDDSVRAHTDRHVAPDGGHLTIRQGSYRLTPLSGGRTGVALETSYELRTPVNFYAAWWGEWMLGDIQENILQIIKDRAEVS